MPIGPLVARTLGRTSGLGRLAHGAPVKKVDQRSIPFNSDNASSMSTPRYCAVLSIFGCLSSSWTARRMPISL